MRTLRAAALAAALALIPQQASAEIIDLSTMTCERFLQSSENEIGTILTWLNAYYRAEDDPAIIDTDKFNEDAAKLGSYCRDNPTVGLITASNELFDK